MSVVPHALPQGLCVAVRQVVGWFDCTGPDAFSSEKYPVFILEDDVGNWYGFPQQRQRRSGPAGEVHGEGCAVTLPAAVLCRGKMLCGRQ